MRKLLACLAAAGILVLFSCGVAYRNTEVRRFIGQPESELIRTYGNPWSVQYDSKGRKVITFELRSTEEVEEEGESWTDSSGKTHYRPPRVRRETHVEHRIFTIGQNGLVVKADWKIW